MAAPTVQPRTLSSEDLVSLRQDLANDCKTFTHDESDAEDLAQDGVVILLTHPEADQPKAYAYVSVRNRFFDQQTRKRRHQSDFDFTSLEDDFNSKLMLSPHQREETRQCVRKHVMRLPPLYRDVLDRCLKGQSYTQISASLGVPEGTIRTRCCRALKRLARIPELHRLFLELEDHRE